MVGMSGAGSNAANKMTNNPVSQGFKHAFGTSDEADEGFQGSNYNQNVQQGRSTQPFQQQQQPPYSGESTPGSNQYPAQQQPAYGAPSQQQGGPSYDQGGIEPPQSSHGFGHHQDQVDEYGGQSASRDYGHPTGQQAGYGQQGYTQQGQSVEQPPGAYPQQGYTGAQQQPTYANQQQDYPEGTQQNLQQGARRKSFLTRIHDKLTS